MMTSQIVIREMKNSQQ
nr:unnamed protein product [Callosobruchus analis]